MSIFHEYARQRPSRDPFEYARNILSRATLELVLRLPSINHYGHAILNRWALHTPDILKTLLKDEVAFINRLIQQQQLEEDVLISNQHMRQQGLVDLDIMRMHEIEMELTPSSF